MKHYLILILSVLMFISCGQQKQETNQPTLTVTIEPLRFFTEAIAGEHYNVVSMVPAGSNPETYDPAPQQLVTLNKSVAYLRIGYIGFEQAWMERLQANAPDLPVFDTSKDVELMEGHSHGDTPAVEPHIWNSTRNARTIADNIFRALCQLDADHTDYYRERLNRLNHCIERTEQTIRALLPEVKSETFLIYHPALTYFARDYGLTQISIEDDGKEPSPTHLQTLIRNCRRDKVKVIFVQQEFDTRNAQVIAREVGARIVPINPLSYDWEQEMTHIIQALTE